MLALSSPLFVWPLENLTSREQIGTNRETLETNSDHSYLPSPPIFDDFATKMSEFDGVEITLAKKLNHNASERDRRRKINSLYFSLNSLLPKNDHEERKKLSVPTTITRVVKYIPELRQEVEKLEEIKEALKSRVNKSKARENLEIDQVNKKQRKCGVNEGSLGVICASKLGDEDVIIQLCVDKNSIKVSEILITIEEERLLPLNISSFESFGERVFYNIHLQVLGTQTLNLGMLKSKLLSIHEKKKELHS